MNRHIRLLDSIHDTAKLANTDLFSTDFRPTKVDANNNGETTIRVTIAVDTSVTLNVLFDDGSSSVTAALNSGTPLIPDALYTFAFGAINTDTINFQVDGNATILKMIVGEVTAEVA